MWEMDNVLLTASPSDINEVQGSDEQFRIYPNPVKNQLTLEIYAGERHGVIDIYNPQGSLVKTVKINSNYKEIDVSDLPSGMYIIKVPDEREPFIKQFIKR